MKRRNAKKSKRRNLEPGTLNSEPETAFGEVCAGWTAQSWAWRLRYLADRCEALHPDKAKYYREWAAAIQGRLTTED